MSGDSLLRKMQQAGRACPGHTRRVDGQWLIPEYEQLGMVITSNGMIQYRTRCTICQRDTSAVLPSKVAKMLVAQGRQFEWTRTNPPRDLPKCVHRKCEEKAEEWHHFAPRNTFGVDADDWPVEPLCRTHHREWHDRMDGYRTNQKGVA